MTIIDSGSGAGRILIWTCAIALGSFFLWASWAELDQITRATGQVITSSRNQVIQSPEGGVLAEMLVREGASVKRGQPLARFDKTKTEASLQESLAKAAALKATASRLSAEITGDLPEFPPELNGYQEFTLNQLELFNKRLTALYDEVSALGKSANLVKEELEMTLPLVKAGDVSRSDVIRLQRQLVDIESQITNRKNKYLQDCQAELSKTEEELAGVMQIVAQRKEQLDFTEIHSPMDGVVRNVQLTTLGGVAKPGEEIMQIVPVGDDLVIEAKVRPSDIAFIKPGLPATIKLDAYDYSIYGTLEGMVTYISADTLNENIRGSDQPFYRVQVKTSTRNLVSKRNERIDIQPGMTAVTEIKTGKKTVLSYLVKPIIKTVSESMGER